MTGQRLHNFDVELCRYTLHNVRAPMRDSTVAAYVEEQLDPALLAHLKALDGNDEPQELLLSDAELEELMTTFLIGPHEFDHDWEPYVVLHRRHIDCAAEIRAGLAVEYVREWARVSTEFAEQLESGRVTLSGGIEIIRAWVRETRRLLRAMGAAALLPPPGGTFVTPTNPEPTSPQPSEAAAEMNAPRGADLATAVAEIRDLLISQRTVKDWYTTEEVGNILGKAEFTVREWCRHGRVHAEKKGSGRGKYQSWVLAHAELLRIQREGLLPIKG